MTPRVVRRSVGITGRDMKLRGHKNTRHIGIGYLQGYGLKRGAVATSVSHDSHNIIVVGAGEEDMAAAVNRVAENRGGIVVMEGGRVQGEVVPSYISTPFLKTCWMLKSWKLSMTTKSATAPWRRSIPPWRRPRTPPSPWGSAGRSTPS